MQWSWCILVLPLARCCFAVFLSLFPFLSLLPSIILAAMGNISANLSSSSFVTHTHTHSLSLVLVVMTKSKEPKTKIYSHAHSLIHSQYTLSLDTGSSWLSCCVRQLWALASWRPYSWPSCISAWWQWVHHFRTAEFVLRFHSPHCVCLPIYHSSVSLIIPISWLFYLLSLVIFSQFVWFVSYLLQTVQCLLDLQPNNIHNCIDNLVQVTMILFHWLDYSSQHVCCYIYGRVGLQPGHSQVALLCEQAPCLNSCSCPASDSEIYPQLGTLFDLWVCPIGRADLTNCLIDLHSLVIHF